MNLRFGLGGHAEVNPPGQGPLEGKAEEAPRLPVNFTLAPCTRRGRGGV